MTAFRLQSSPKEITLSVIVPVYNERYLVRESLRRLQLLERDPNVARAQVIVVDDGSTDGTGEILRGLEREWTSWNGANISWLFLRHQKNQGKGAAIRTGLAHASCEVTIIHDADLEYDPADISRIARVFQEHDADAVLGSRFAGADVRRVLLFRHQMGNKFLTFACNLVSNLNLTDAWTCYKAVRTSLLKSIPIESNDFRIEPELVIKLAKRDARIFEIPISYFGRTYQEGKKINWRDGLRAFLAILQFSLTDQVFQRDKYGSQVLQRLARAPRFNRWLADTIRPFCGDSVLEVGSGIGNISRMLVPRTNYVASDVNPAYLQTLHQLASNRPYFSVSYSDVTKGSSFPAIRGGYSTVVCLNVLEHIDDDRAALNNIREIVSENGCAIILVPYGPWNYGTLDQVLGHCRRYTRQDLRRLAEDCGFTVTQMLEFNRAGTIAWYLNGKLMRRRRFGLAQVWLLNIATPVLRTLDRWLPIPPLSIVAILHPKTQSVGPDES